jgi:hypothetical protein
VPRAGLDVRRIHPVEHVDDLDVAERIEPLERLGLEALIEPDDGLDALPVVVDGLGAAADDRRDRLETQCGGHQRIMANGCP